MNLPGGVQVVEVSPRDGLQDEATVVSVESRVELIERAAAAGIRRVEAVSFVRADRVPTMAGAEAVMERVRRARGVSLSALVLNDTGMDRALACGVDEVNVVVPVTDTFCQHNQAASVADAMATAERITHRASNAGVASTITLAVAFGCPFEGAVDPEVVRAIARRAASYSPSELALADTIGCAVPTEVTHLVTALVDDTGLAIRAHLHNSRNTGYANAVAALAGGVTALDASIGGLGGCPFAPGASGNVATEDLVNMLERMGVATNADLESLIDTALWLGGIVGHDVASQLVRSGPFPKTRA